ncbi:MAG: hypothetical protein UHD09_01465 [Bifidobacterium sp.]|nr:hypothetical protein [Bifidobacterium sp.]
MQADDLMEHAFDAFADGDYRAAEDAYRQAYAIDLDPLHQYYAQYSYFCSHPLIAFDHLDMVVAVGADAVDYVSDDEPGYACDQLGMIVTHAYVTVQEMTTAATELYRQERVDEETMLRAARLLWDAGLTLEELTSVALDELEASEEDEQEVLDTLKILHLASGQLATTLVQGAGDGWQPDTDAVDWLAHVVANCRTVIDHGVDVADPFVLDGEWQDALDDDDYFAHDLMLAVRNVVDDVMDAGGDATDGDDETESLLRGERMLAVLTGMRERFADIVARNEANPMGYVGDTMEWTNAIELMDGAALALGLPEETCYSLLTPPASQCLELYRMCTAGIDERLIADTDDDVEVVADEVELDELRTFHLSFAEGFLALFDTLAPLDGVENVDDYLRSIAMSVRLAIAVATAEYETPAGEEWPLEEDIEEAAAQLTEALDARLAQIDLGDAMEDDLID